MNPTTFREMLERISFPLVYHDYSIEDKIYHLADGGCGIMFQCQPQTGGMEVSSGLRAMYEVLPEGAAIQVIMWANPNVTWLVDEWKRRKTLRTGLYGEIVENISEFFDGTNKAGTKTHDYCLYITVKLGGKDVPQNTFTMQHGKVSEEYRKNYITLKDCYTRVFGALETAKLYPVECTPDRLIAFVYSVLNQKHNFRDMPTWDGSACIDDFCVANNTAIEVTDTHIVCDGVYGKSLSVKDYPEEWALPMSDFFTGSVLGGMTIDVPILISLNLIKCGQGDYNKVKRNAHVVLNQKFPAALFPKLRMKQNDLAYANDRLARGEPLYHVNLSLFVFGDTLEKLDTAVGQIKSYYQSNLFKLEEDIYINHAALLSILPFSWDNEMNIFMKRGRTLFVDSAIDLSPVSADNCGSAPEVLFTTPRGQLYGFDLYANEAGGFNFFVVGTTGAGKSVALQYIAINYLIADTGVFILDIGGSYKRFCNTFLGQYIEIDPEKPICLNPWTDIKDDKMFRDFETFLADWYYLMGAPLDRQMSDQLEKLIKSVLNQALERSWYNYGNKSDVGTVIKELQNLNKHDQDPRVKDFITTLLPYSPEGPHGAFFNGVSQIHFDARLVVLENGKMENIPELRDPIIMILTYHISKHIYVNEKLGTRYLVMIDEAHKFLGNPKIDLFIEQAYRRFRKHGASMGVGTQGFEDLYDAKNTSKAGRVIVQNSAYKIFMLQTSVSRETMKKSGLFALTTYYEAMLDSVLPSKKYSEAMIISEQSKVKVRVVLPKLLQTLFFSGKDIRMQIEQLVEQEGITYAEAVKRISQEV